MKSRIVVTGIGAVTPLGNSVASFWEALVAGRSGAAPITRFDTTNLETKFAAEVKDFDPLNAMDRKDARRSARVVHYTVAAAREAVAQACLHVDDYIRDRVGVVIGTAVGGV